MFSPLYLDNFISATRITPQSGKARAVRDDLVEAGRASGKHSVGSRGRLQQALRSA